MNCIAGSGHVQALVKRRVGPVRDPKHRSQECVRSARRSGQSAVSPDKVGATSTDTESTDFVYTIHHHHAQVFDWDFTLDSWDEIGGYHYHVCRYRVIPSSSSPLRQSFIVAWFWKV